MFTVQHAYPKSMFHRMRRGGGGVNPKFLKVCDPPGRLHSRVWWGEGGMRGGGGREGGGGASGFESPCSQTSETLDFTKKNLDFWIILLF